MKNILTLLFLVFFLSVAYGQSETEKELKQALEYYQNLEYAKALPIYEKYEVALLEAGKDDPELLKSIYTVFYTCYQGTGQSEKAQKYQKLISEVAPGQSKTEKEFLQAIKNYQAGQFAKALPIFEKYKEEYLLLIKYNDTETLGFYQALKTCYEKTGQPEKAQKYQKLITEMESELPDTWQRLNEKGGIAYQVGNYKEATAFFEKAKIQAEKEFGKQHQNYSISCNNLAYLYAEQGVYMKAEALYMEAKDIQAKVLGKQHPDYATSCNNLGLLYESQGVYTKAEPLYIEAKEIREKVLGKEHPDYAQSCNNLAGLYANQGAYIKAEALYMEAKDIRAKLLGKQHPDYAQSCNNLAYLYDKQGVYTKAEPLFIEAKAIYEKVLGKQHPDYALSCNNLAVLYDNQGAYIKAEALFIEAKAIYEKVLGKQHPDYAQSCNNLALLYNGQGLYTQAEALFIEAKDIQEKALGKEHPDYAKSCNDLALLYNGQSLYTQAEPLFIEAKDIQEKVLGKQHPSYATSCNNLALLYDNQGAYIKAEALYMESKAIIEKVLGKEHPDYAKSCNNLGLLYNGQGLYTQAEPLFIEAKDIQEKVLGKEHPDYAKSCNNLGLLYDNQGVYIKAESLYREAIQNKQAQIKDLLPTMSEAERKQYIQSIKDYFGNFYSFTVKYYQEKPQIASDLFNLQILLKGLLFQSTQKMQRQILSSGNEALIQKYRGWKTKRQYLAYLLTLPSADKAKQGISPQKETELKEEANQLEKELSQESEAFASAFDTKDYTWQDIQKQLKSNEAVLEMIRMRTIDDETDKIDTVYVALILTPQSQYPEMAVLDNGQELEGKYLKSYRDNIQTQTKDTEAYEQFWKNLTPALSKGEGVSKVYFSPDGVYNQINLSTLWNPATQEYLQEELDIQLIASSKDLVKPRKASKNTQASTLVGFPDYQASLTEPLVYAGEVTGKIPKASRSQNLNTGKRKISLLPQTKVEVQKISQLMQSKGISNQSYLEKEATEGLVKRQQSPRVLHIATHGFYASIDSTAFQKKKRQSPRLSRSLDTDYKKIYVENPLLRSGLLLAGSENTFYSNERSAGLEDGILTAQEVMNLELDHTELVVLSACETGLGDVSVGEGVYGLQRSFQQAGAKTVLMSLWKVNDQVTQELLVLFYENWLGKKMPKREAFKEAKKQIQAKHPAPYFWGAFVMIGE